MGDVDGYYIPANSQHQQEALKLIRYLSDQWQESGVRFPMRKSLAAMFRETEDAAGYLLSLRDICPTRGLLLTIYADRLTIFQIPTKPTIDQTRAGKPPLSQYGRAFK